MPQNLGQKLIASHLVAGRMVPGEEIGVRIDQILMHDATGPLIMLELEAMDLTRIRVELGVGYIDHMLVQQDERNADDHLLLRSACQRFGLWYSPPGNGISHPVHQERFGKPGKSLLGADSHTPAAGAIGMLAIGAGGVEIAVAMAGQPYSFKMPEVWGVRLEGALPDWVSAKDVILEMLRRHGVAGAKGRILEYFGPGLASLSAMDRHVIANMGTELGATTSVFPSDREVGRFLRRQGRAQDWIELSADDGAVYDHYEVIDLSQLEPLIALPSSPGRVVPVREVAGREIYQAYLGSSANPGFRDFAVAASVVQGRRVHDRVSFDVNPSGRQMFQNLLATGHLMALVQAGARIHQAGCNGCIGMGQAPATDRISLRTVPRNFPGRSGTREDQVYLCSPETTAASALTGVITDPRRLEMPYPRIEEPRKPIVNTEMLVPPLPDAERRNIELRKGPYHAPLPTFDPLPDQMQLPVLLKMGHDVSTDEIVPGGTRAMPLWSSIPKLSDHAFVVIDDTYPQRALEVRPQGGHTVVAGINYGQGSSREQAALVPRNLGLRAVIAESFARIHHDNLVNFGVLPLIFSDRAVREEIHPGDELLLRDLRQGLSRGGDLTAENATRGSTFSVHPDLSPRQVAVLLAGGIINWMRNRLS